MWMNILLTILITFCVYTEGSKVEKNIQTVTAPITPRIGRVITNGTIRIKLSEPKNYILCEVTTPNGQLFGNDIQLPNNNIILLNNTYPDQMYWLTTECGVILSSVSKFSDGTWKLSAKYEDFLYENKSTISVIGLPEPEIEVRASLGSSVTIVCTTGIPTLPAYCKIYDNNGKLVSRKCSFPVPLLTLNHFGNWTCKMGLLGAFEEITQTIMLHKNDEDLFRYSISQINSQISMSCTLLKNRSIRWCRAVAPNGNQYYLLEGVMTDKYSSFGTSLDEKRCGIEIKLPLQNYDNGIWRLDFGTSETDFIGCFISTSNTKKRGLQIEKTNVEKLDVAIGSTLNLECSVSWPISYCYARHPNGSYLYSNYGLTDDIYKTGICRISVDKITSDMSGRWTCGLSAKDGTSDMLFYKDINVIETDLIAIEDYVKGVYGEDLYLLCKSPTKRPLKYCQFISPTEKSFLLQPIMIDSNPRYMYWGSYVANGECGILIKNLQPEDVGSWKCTVSFLDNNKRSLKEIFVEVPRTANAFVLGGSIVGIILFLISTIFLIKIYRKRRTRNENRSPSVSSDEPITSGIGNVPMYALSTPVHRRSIESNTS